MCMGHLSVLLVCWRGVDALGESLLDIAMQGYLQDYSAVFHEHDFPCIFEQRIILMMLEQ